MKKIIRRVSLSVVAVIVAAIAVLAISITHDPDKGAKNKPPQVTDAAGNTYLAVTVDGDDETYAAVTDSSGNVYAAKIKDDGNIGETVASLDGKYSASDLPSNYTGPTIDESVNVNDFTGNVDPVASATTASPSEQTSASQAPSSQNGATTTQAPSTQSAQPEEYRIKKYQKIFSSGAYLMEFTTNDEDLGSTPITTAVKNGNLIIDTQIEGMQCKMLYLASNDTTYLVLDRFRKYCKLPENLMGEEIDLSEMNMMSNFVSSVPDKDIAVSTVNVNGQQLTCESYTASDGTVMKYYFSGDTLVRLDNVDKNGDVSSTFISRITSDVPDSTFEIPDNYGFFNLAWLGALGNLGGGSD